MTQTEFKTLRPGDIVETPNGHQYQIESRLRKGQYPSVLVAPLGAKWSDSGSQFFLAAAAHYKKREP